MQTEVHTIQQQIKKDNTTNDYVKLWLIIEESTVTVRCRTTMKKMSLY